MNDVFTDKNSGYKFCMKMNNPCAEHILQNGIFEYPLILWAKGFLNKDVNFIDIGAHMGTYSVILSFCCNKVYSFEAQSSTYECLIESIRQNECSNVEAYNIALSSNNCRKILYHVSEDGGGSTVDSAMVHQQVIGTEEVQTRILDNYNLTDVGFIKIDVEGHELEVIIGATKTIKNSNYPPILFEAWAEKWYASKKRNLFNHLQILGYKIYPICGMENMFLASDNSRRK